MRREIAGYYADLTEQYLLYGGEAHGWHWGIGKRLQTTHRRALLRSNELLVGGLDIGPATRILDAGCGDGGFAVWAAGRFGCRVTGITICESHLPIARRHAREAGVAKLCRFLCMDMEQLDFPRSSFDVIVNQESFCHVVDKQGYLARVRATLTPSGAWRCIDTFVPQPGAAPARSLRLRREVCAGFHFPSLEVTTRMASRLGALGFETIRMRDLTAGVLSHWRSRAPEPRAMALLGLLGEACFPGARPATRRNLAGHFVACSAMIEALRVGALEHLWLSADGSRESCAGGRRRARPAVIP